MSRWEFMSRLEKLLLYVPIQEREEALQYYNDYFEDAGPEREQEVIAALGSPEQVAENIKRDVYQSNYGTEPDKVESGKEMIEYHPGEEIYEEPMRNDIGEKIPVWAKILILVCTIPLILSVPGAILGVLMGVLGGMFAVLLAGVIVCGAIGLACPIAGIVTVIWGFLICKTNVLASLAVIGVGFLCLAVGVLGIWLETLLVGKGIPAIVMGIGKGIRKLAMKLKGGKKREKIY